MREIKFRGKKIDNKEWVYGGYFQHTEEDCVIHYIFTFENGAIPVDKNTICQFTGIKDQKGIEIYDGDIVKYKEWQNNSDELAFKTNYIVCFEQLKWILKHTSGRYQVTVQQQSGLDSQSLNNDGCKARNFKIIGYVNDNPELLSTI